MRRVLRALVILVGVLVLGGLGLVWYAARASLPVVSGTLTVAGLSAPLTVIRDHGGVPHIYAETAADAAYRLGFVEGQDRRLQMELARRLGEGRLAEVAGEGRREKPFAIAGVVGSSTLDIDCQMRTLGLARIAAADAATLPAEDLALFQAFSAGVNAATDLAGSSGTVRILGAAPLPWTPAASLVLTRLGDLTFAIQRYEELLSATLLAEVGAAGLNALMPPYPDELAPPLVDGDPRAAEASAAAPRLLALRHAGDIGPVLPGVGSNNWVLAGRRTASGAPILASDPHSDVNVPFYVAHLSAPGLEVEGLALFAPEFMIGHNDRIAWGVTLVGADTEDYFVEEIAAGDPPRVRTPDGWQPLTIRHESIAVRGRAEPVDVIVREGPHGPLVYDLNADEVRRALGAQGSGTPGSTYSSALAWTGGLPQPGAAHIAVARARDWESFRAALGNHPGIPLNFVYADVDGHVGYQMAGRIPLREGPAPVTPVLGWERGHAWTGMVPFDALPRAFDPEDGAIATANARITGPHYPYHLATRWCDMPYRVRRIRALLGAKPKLSLDDVAAVQMDVHADAMTDVVAWARGVESDDPGVRRFREALAGWDLEARADSMPAALVEAFRLELVHTFFEPRLSSEAFADYLWSGEGLHLVALKRIMDDPNATFFGAEPARAKTARAVAVEQAARRAIARLEGTLGSDWSAWSWGRVHTVTFEHPFAREGNPGAGVLARLLNVGPFPAPGSPFTVDAGFWVAPVPFRVWMAPMYRQIVDLGDFRRSRWTPGPPGLAEQRLSAHYADLARPWLEGRYRPMLWARADVEADAEATLTLVPRRE